MDKLKLHSPNLTEGNISKIAELFPNCIVEARDDDGALSSKVDFDQLRQELSDSIIEGPQERYRLDWPGKRDALLAANSPIAKTLRPSKHKSVEFDAARNLIIEGDNLDALKLLQETYLGKVKMIFIDPPYNTGKDFIYNDDFKESSDEYFQRSNQTDDEGNRLNINADTNGRFHSDWLSMMYPRLKLSRNLLKDDGVIFIAIDDNEVSNLRKLCDTIFGEQNFVANVVWQKVFAPKNSARWFSEDHDHILVYAKSKDVWQPNQLPQTDEMIARYKNPDADSRGPWTSSDLAARNRYDAGLYSIACPSGRVVDGPPKGRYWSINKEKFNQLDSDNRIWWGKDGDNMPRLKRFSSELKGGRTPQTLWPWKEVGHTQQAKKELLKYVNFEHTENVLNSVKPTALIQRALQLATSADDHDIVLDFFCGSGSTLHAVLKQNAEDNGNRRFIGVQIQEPLPKPEASISSILDMAIARVRNFSKELLDDAELNLTTSNLGFRVFSIDTSNAKDIYYTPDAINQEELALQVDHIKSDRTSEDLLFQVMLDWGVDLALPISCESIQGKDVYFVDENAIAACFDTQINEAFVKELAKREPLRAVFRDTCFESDSAKINVAEIFKLLSPNTDIKTI